MSDSRKIKESGKVFRDPVHRLIRVDPDDGFILDLIDTPEMQRLRRIRQLGVSWLTYHGAEHSRFSHSMGVFNFAQRILQSLEERYKKNDTIRKYLHDNAKTLKAAALLHDVGHAPFSHMLEGVLGSRNHETMTCHLIEDSEGAIAKILQDADIDPCEVSGIINKSSEHQLLKDVVTSQLDADRMDYLLRDSMYTGVEYGRFDSEWIIRNLCIGKDPSAPTISNTDDDTSESAYWRLCLDQDRGLHSAEQLIIARLHMTMQVYYHRVTRGYEILIHNLLAEAKRLSNELPDRTPFVLRDILQNDVSMSRADWLRFDEPMMFAAFSTWQYIGDRSNKYDNLRRLSRAFLQRERIYKARELSGMDLGIGGPGTELNNFQRGIDWELDKGKCLPYKGLIYSAQTEREKASEESILLSSGDYQDHAKVAEIDSKILKSLDSEGMVVGRIYYDRNKANEIEMILDKCRFEA